MLSPQLWGALTRWLLKGCKTNFFKDEWNNKKDNENFVIGIIVALLILGLSITLVNYNLL